MEAQKGQSTLTNSSITDNNTVCVRSFLLHVYECRHETRVAVCTAVKVGYFASEFNCEV